MHGNRVLGAVKAAKTWLGRVMQMLETCSSGFGRDGWVEIWMNVVMMAWDGGRSVGAVGTEGTSELPAPHEYGNGRGYGSVPRSMLVGKRKHVALM